MANCQSRWSSKTRGAWGCMTLGDIEIRESATGDSLAIERVYVDAFPDEDLLPLVRQLLKMESGLISLVAVVDNAIVGHVGFSMCQIADSENEVALLAPLAVSPTLHKQGIGSALVRTGFARLENAGLDFVLVLGDPTYYGRFGFRKERDVVTPYRLPEDWDGAWQSVHLGDSQAIYQGQLIVPGPWQCRELWSS